MAQHVTLSQEHTEDEDEKKQHQGHCQAEKLPGAILGQLSVPLCCREHTKHEAVHTVSESAGIMLGMWRDEPEPGPGMRISQLFLVLRRVSTPALSLLTHLVPLAWVEIFPPWA